MNIKRIVLSLGIIVVVGAIAFAGTRAFFSDTETSTGNTFAAGSIDLSLGSTFSSNGDANGEAGSFPILSDNDGRMLYAFNDLKPGDYGWTTFDFTVTSNEAYVCAMSELDSFDDNGINDPEGDAGDVTDGAGAGELQDYLQFAIFHDVNGNGVWDAGEPFNRNQFIGDGDGFTAAEVSAAGWIGVADNSAPNTWLAPLASTQPSVEYNAGFMYCFGDFTADGVCEAVLGENYNITQTDSISGSIVFEAYQTRNNEDFVCTDLNDIDEEEPEGPLVGAALGAFSAPAVESCDAVVELDESIQEAIDTEVSDNETVCVASSYTGAGDNTPIRINKDGVTVVALVQGTALDVPVVLDNDNTTVTGFEGFVGQAESPAEVAAFYIDGDADNVEVSFNTVNGGENGVLTETSATLSGALIANNVFENLTRGIFFNPSQNMVAEYNDFFSNTVGIANDEPGSNIIRNNVFSGNGESVGYLDDANAGIVLNGELDVVFNNIHDGDVNNWSASTALDAPNNWWGGDGSADQVNQAGPNTAAVNTAPEAGAAYPEN